MIYSEVKQIDLFEASDSPPVTTGHGGGGGSAAAAAAKDAAAQAAALYGGLNGSPLNLRDKSDRHASALLKPYAVYTLVHVNGMCRFCIARSLYLFCLPISLV